MAALRKLRRRIRKALFGPSLDLDKAPSLFRKAFAKIWQKQDPYRPFRRRPYKTDLQGWNSEHPYLTSSLDLAPGLVVEVGVWKGASTITMARHLKQRNINGAIVAVDTFLGSAEHWIQPDLRQHLRLRDGFPEIYRVFLSNVVREKLDCYVVPLPIDSGNAAEILRKLGLRPSVIHIDGAHDYVSVSADLERWWPLLKRGGIMILDDYTGVWPGVVRAVDEFIARMRPVDVEFASPKCRFRKPAAAAVSSA